MSVPPRLILATRNPHKSAEIRALLGDRFSVLDVSDCPECPHIEETGTTFLENARLKALGISRQLDGWVLSDDSGLEVDALHGAPGVHSSSFGGQEGNHALNNAALLTAMKGQANRCARFRCTLVLARNGLEQAHFSATVEGQILDSPRGDHGFGYDPLFQPDGHDSSFAELGEAIKNTLSHRSRALSQAISFLHQSLAVSSESPPSSSPPSPPWQNPTRPSPGSAPPMPASPPPSLL